LTATDVNARTGGCLCGAVRYAVAWPPIAQATCSCRNCQKQSGSALSVVLVFQRDSLEISGDLRTYLDKGHSGQDVLRKFCPECGSPVLTDTPEAEANGIIFVKGGTIDNSEDLDPTTHYWLSNAQKWVRWPDGSGVLETQ
jgi:hypothetical protein